MATKDAEDQDVDGRLHDGYAYCVELANGRKARFCDHDRIDAIMKRLEDLEEETFGAAEKLPPEDFNSKTKFQARWGRAKLKFSGARDKTTEYLLDDNEDEVEGSERDVIGKLDGKGFILAQHVVAISYWGTSSEILSDAALEAASAVEGARREAAETRAEIEAKKAAKAMETMFGGKPTGPEGEEEDEEVVKPVDSVDPGFSKSMNAASRAAARQSKAAK